MSWRLAKSLSVLRLEANTVAPKRAKHHDGTVGDLSHQARSSRHNPNAASVVCAVDITHDPAHGMDTYDLFDWLRLNPHPDLEYVISNRRIASRNRGWVTRTYSGASPHDMHIHVAVGRGLERNAQPPYDTQLSWRLSSWKFGPLPQTEEDELTAQEREMLQYAAMWSLEAKIDANIAKTLAKGDPVAAAKIEAVRKDTIAHWKERWGVV